MTSQQLFANDLSDDDLLTQVNRVVGCERQATAQLIALLGEVDARKLYAGQGCSSLFAYCVQVLHLSEHAAYLRIEAARLARRFPAILERLADSSLHLTAVNRLGPHITAANHVELFDAATHKSKREVEQLIARLRPQDDVPSSIRKVPTPKPVMLRGPTVIPSTATPAARPECLSSGYEAVPIVATPPVIKPLAPERYKVQFTVSGETYQKLRRVQDLMRHSIPDGDPAVIFDRALTLLLTEVSKTKFAATDQPRRARPAAARSWRGVGHKYPITVSRA